MRKVFSGLFVSLDGVAEAPNEWQFDGFDDDMGNELNKVIAQTDTVLLGRVTFQEWADYWPNATTDMEFTDFINNTPKYVVSNTLDNVDNWQNSTLIKGNQMVEEITRLKEQPGGMIAVTGSPGLVASLLENDLLDELQLLVHPVVVGHGKHLFKEGSSLKRLKLVESKTSSTGVSMLTYQPK